MKKKFLALVLTLAMVLSLAPVGALATNGEEESQTPEDVIYDYTAHSGNATVDGVDSLNKTAKKTGENTYEVKLEVKMHETTSTISQAAATVLVIDISESMNDYMCGKEEHTHFLCPPWCEKEHSHTDACGGRRLDAAKAAAENFVNTYAGTVENAGRYLSIVVFGTNADVTLDWTDVSTDSGKNSAKSAIDVLSVKGGTNLEQGLANAKSKLEEHTVSSVNFKNVVALTDGAPTYYGAPDKWGNPSGGDGSNGSKGINEKTAETARNLKEIANLYTVCFGAANQYTYKEYHLIGGTTYGPTVGKFLEKSIATDSNHAYNADNADKLNNVFKEISQNITSGLSAGTVHDALPKGVSSDAFNGKTTADWDLNTFDKEITDEGNTKHYTYTKTYTVTIDPEEINPDLLDKNDYYPLNGQTTLKVTVNNEEQELNFPIPYGKVKFNTYSVTYKDGAEGAVFDDSITDNLRKGADIPAYDNEDSIHRDGYTFSGWKWYQGETELTAKPNTMPAANLVAVAQWTANTYTVIWKNGEATLETDTGVAYNSDPSYDSATPTKEEDDRYTYEFAGWSADKNAESGSQASELPKVTENVTYYAVFTKTAKTYTVTWKNGEATLETDTGVAYNSDPSYDSAAPTKEEDDRYTYEFAGWSADKNAESGSQASELPKVTENVTYYAVFTKTAKTYTVNINRHLMGADGIKVKDLQPQIASGEKNTVLSTLFTPDQTVTDDNKNYVYVPASTTVTQNDGTATHLDENATLTAEKTVIDLYYYLDNWKDADETTDSTDKDSETGGDGIPDCYQVLVKYQSGDTKRGSVGPLTMEVLTIKSNDVYASKGQVVASGSTANATGSRCYFSNWTNDDNQQIANSATLEARTIDAKGGDVYTFTANFGRSSGGSNRPKPPVVEIPDDVPTGLNGKDHYAYVVGYPDGMVYPQKNITRAEVATIFFRLLKDETREANMTKSNSYNDMKDGAWYTCAVSTLSKMGIIKGYEDGSFKPDASISRAEFAAIAARFDPDGDKTPATFSDVSSHWAKDEISIAANHGWIKGYEDGSFKPDQKITRAETMTLVNRVLKRLPETKDDLHKDMKTWPDNQNESAWFYLAVQEATNSHYQKLKKDGTHETWESMRETRDWAALEK